MSFATAADLQAEPLRCCGFPDVRVLHPLVVHLQCCIELLSCVIRELLVDLVPHWNVLWSVGHELDFVPHEGRIVVEPHWFST